MKIKNRFIILSVITMIFLSCSVKGKAVGRDEDILVLSDQVTYEIFKRSTNYLAKRKNLEKNVESKA